jgi:hypothetical protein
VAQSEFLRDYGNTRSFPPLSRSFGAAGRRGAAVERRTVRVAPKDFAINGIVGDVERDIDRRSRRPAAPVR